MFKSRLYSIGIHILFWSIYICFPLFVLPQASKLINSNVLFLIGYLISSVFSILFFYFNYNWTIPKFFFPKKYFMYIMSSILFIAFALISLKLLEIKMLNNNLVSNELKPPFAMSFIFRFGFIFIISFSIRVYRKMLEVQTEKAMTELSLLKAQINPHFLFNTLNGLYGLALTKSDLTAESIAKLSSIMQYAISEANNTKVSLEKEVDYILDYVDLQKLRLTEKTKVLLKVSGDLHGKFIEPLLLISFIENAFKYGVSTEAESTIEIELSTQNNLLLFNVSNDKVAKSYNSRESSNEIGLTNTKKRLDLMYTNQHKLVVKNTQSHFQIKLELDLK